MIETSPDVRLTKRAAEHVKRVCDRKGGESRMRLALKPAGCSGYEYVVEMVDDIHASDRVMESHGVRLIIDEQSLKHLVGTEIDFIKQGLNSGFQFSNPNVGDTCGCGESFSLKEGHGAQ